MSLNSVEFYEGNKLKIINLFPQNVQIDENQFKRKWIDNFEELDEENIDDFVDDLVENFYFSETIKEKFDVDNNGKQKKSQEIKKYQRLE